MFRFELWSNEAPVGSEGSKVVEEYVGTEGRRPSPVILEAIRNWQPILGLKHLQEFLGTANYVPPHAGAGYSQVVSPLRTLLKPGAVFPPNELQLAAIAAVTQLMAETHRLTVPERKLLLRLRMRG